jgi:hypothetical protein
MWALNLLEGSVRGTLSLRQLDNSRNFPASIILGSYKEFL